MLQIRNLSKIYSNGATRVVALTDLNIDLGSKGLVVILGKSGCGKSTLINMIGGLDYPTRGEIIINGRSSRTFSKPELDSYRNTFVGVVFQEFNLIDEISVFENIDMTMKLQEKDADVNTVDEVLSMVGLNNLGYRKPSELSGGQRQRVALARALLKKPEIILADEPTGSLDSTTGEEVFESLKKIAQDKLVIVVTHDRELAYTYGERIVELSDGRITSDYVRQSEIDSELRELSDNVIESASPSKLTASHINKRLQEDEVNYIGLSYDKERIALAYSETVDSFYEKSDTHKYAPTQASDIKNNNKPFALSKGKMQLSEAFKMARANIKRTKKRYALLTILTTFCFTFLIVAIIASSVNLSGLVAKAATSAHSQDVLSVTKTQKDEYDRINEAPMEISDAKAIADTLGTDNYVFHSTVYMSPQYASWRPNDYNADYFYFEPQGFKLTGFSGILEGSPADIGLKLFEGSKSHCDDYEIIISDMAAFELQRSGFVGFDKQGNSGLIYVAEFNDLLGAKLKLQTGDPHYKNELKDYYTIAGIFKTDYEDYKQLLTSTAFDSNAEKLFSAFVQNNKFLYSKVFVSDTFLERYSKEESKSNKYINYEYTSYGYGSGNSYEQLVINPNLQHKYTELYWSQSGNLKIPSKLNAGEILITLDAAHHLLGLSSYTDLKNDNRFLELVNTPLQVRIQYYSDALSKNISKTQSFTIVGVLASAYGDQNLYWDMNAYFSSEDLDEFLSGANYTSIYTAKTGSRYTLEKKISALKDDGYYVSCAMLDAIKIADLESAINMIALVFLYMSLGLAVFAFLIIFNYMSSSVRFRRKEIAVYRVIGAKSSDIAKIFLSECFVITVRITIIVSILAWIVCWFINLILQSIVSYLGISVTLITFSFFHPIIVFLLVAAFFVLSSLIPIRSVTRKTPVEALKML